MTTATGRAPSSGRRSVSSGPRRSRAGGDAGRPGSDERKVHVLSHHDASSVRSIADALVIKDGEPFFVCPRDGQVRIDDRHGFGLYHHDTRFLSGYEVHIAGAHPIALAAAAPNGQEALIELTNEAIEGDREPAVHPAGRAADETDETDRDPSTIAKQQLAIHWTRVLDGDGVELTDEIVVANHSGEPARTWLEVRFSAGFEDVFEIRGMLDGRRGTVHDPAWIDDALEFRYDGADAVVRTTRISIDPPPTERGVGRCRLRLDVAARGTARVRIGIRAHEQRTKGAAPLVEASGAGPRRGGRQLAADGLPIAGGPDWGVTIRSEALALETVLARSLSDLRTLLGELDGRRYYAAGIPWFSALFGRDSLIAAYQTLAFDPTIAADTLRLLAGRQGSTTDDWRDEEPGRILHELRVGELARLREIPHTPYYGSIDSTPLFLIVLAEHAAWTGSLALFRELRSNVERALDWIDGSMARSPGGYLAYASSTKGGLVNQGWKDSGNAIVTAAGGLAQPPIALAEVQGYVYRAKRALAGLFRRDGAPDRAVQLDAEAEDLQRRFEADFWSDELGCYALALARDGRSEVVTSNAGQVLWSGIASDDHAHAVAERLFQDDMFAGWGIRTLSSKAAAWNPVGYHLGTIWPHDNALIGEGLRAYGEDERAEQILSGLVEAATDFDLHRLPECMAGFGRQRFGVPVRYPIACHPQAWAAGAVPQLLVSCLGLHPDPDGGGLRAIRPRLPSFVPALEIRGMPIGDQRVDVDVRRSEGRTTARISPVRGASPVGSDRGGGSPAEAETVG
jgi:glycogen debranching enzyme